MSTKNNVSSYKHNRVRYVAESDRRLMLNMKVTGYAKANKIRFPKVSQSD